MSVGALIRDERGVVALLGALLLPVLLGVGALAVDVSQYRLASNRMQGAADAGALAAVQSLSNQPAAIAAAVDYARRNVPASFGEITRAADVTFGAYDPVGRVFTPTAVNVNAVRVTAGQDATRGNAAPRFLSAIFGQEGVSISVSSIAARPRESVPVAQTLYNLGAASATYNEVSAYCFDQSGTGTAASRRSKMTVIADNVTTAAKTGAYWPQCAAGQSLSFRMRIVSGGKWYPERVTPTNGDNFYSDTVIKDGKQVFDKSIAKKLEIVRCDTAAQCRPKGQGGIVPEGGNRTPVQDPAACEPGKFIYFGGEDWNDNDYDDIRFAMACPDPDLRTWAYGSPRLVR